MTALKPGSCRKPRADLAAHDSPGGAGRPFYRILGELHGGWAVAWRRRGPRGCPTSHAKRATLLQ